MPFWLSLIDDGAAGRLAQKLLISGGKLAVGAEAVQVGLSHTVEGLVTPLLRDEAPKDTSALADSLRAHTTRAGNETIVSFDSDVPYSDDVIHGTGIYHTPDAHSEWDVTGLQVFQVGGETIFTLHTHHLGQHPNDFPGRAMERAQPLIDAALTVAGERLLITFASEFGGEV